MVSRKEKIKMKDIAVKDLMVPLAEYATVPQDATLYEAILSLEEARAEFESTPYRHRALLVFDKDNHIIGKLSQMDIIKALEPDFGDKLGEAHLSRFGISNSYIEFLLKENDCWNLPLDQLCTAAGGQRVADFMYTPTEGEYIPVDASLQNAIHRLLMGHHHSLLVTGENSKEIVGVLRLTDVFVLVCQTMKAVFNPKGRK